MSVSLALLVVLLLALLIVLGLLLRAIVSLQVDMRGVRERVTSVEQQQGSARQGLSDLIYQTGSTLQGEIAQARERLAELRTEARTRTEMDRQVAESVRRLETVIAGTQSKGAAGENILEAIVAKLPAEWWVRNFTVNNKTVEFALRLPNKRLVPIDSKWAATHLLERLAVSEDPLERQRLKDQIEGVIVGKAREVRKYLHPDLTVDFGIAAVPDAVYDLCPSAQSACFEHNVVLIAYSMFIPYLLLVFQTVLRTSQGIDLERLDSHLRAVEAGIREVQEEVEGRLSRAIVMLDNGRSDMRNRLSLVQGSLDSLRVGSGGPEIPR